MARRTWDVRLEDGRHRVTLDHGYWTGRIEISVNGRVVERTRKFFEVSLHGTDLPFRIGEHWLAVAIRQSGIAYRYDLFLDARSVETGKLAEPIERHARPVARLWLQLLPAAAAPAYIGAGRGGPLAPLIVGGAVAGAATLLAALGNRVLARVENEGRSGWRSGLTTVAVILGAYAATFGILVVGVIIATVLGQ